MNTLGDHLRKVRLDRGLSQPEVAKMLEVNTDSVTGWELNRFDPTPKFAKAIIEFLGYLPFADTSHTLGKHLHYARLISGKTQRQVAKEIDCNESTLRRLELDLQKPFRKTLKKIQGFIERALAVFDDAIPPT